MLATVCATTEQRPPIDLRASSHAIDMVAAIEESPTTIGLADSNLVRLDNEDLIDQQLDMMQALGVQNVRIGISWISTQFSEDGSFFWGATDYVINEAHRRGMGVLGVLHETPAWAGSPPLSGVPNLDAFGRFAGAVAERYEGKISALEVWNEPNGRFFLNPVDPAAYTGMVKAAYAAIKAHDDPRDPDDDITVVAGVLGSGRTLGDNFTMNPIDFLQGMYDADAHGYFDAFSFHPYHYDIPFSEGATQSDSPILQLRAIRELMEQYGDGDLKVWASEYGLPTTPFDPLHPLLYNSPEKQAEFLADFLASWQRENGTGPIFIYSTRDINSGSASDQDNFGIWYTDWTEKPAVQVIRDFLEDLRARQPDPRCDQERHQQSRRDHRRGHQRCGRFRRLGRGGVHRRDGVGGQDHRRSDGQRRRGPRRSDVPGRARYRRRHRQLGELGGREGQELPGCRAHRAGVEPDDVHCNGIGGR
ncbi:cellulase family glycosylhydrolase [Mycobacterium sp. ITM-2016-00316]|uniref:cellulase family glycosylhydrolase n=1 Tax=Mycobacterium sp. ITM-2016-00316 TaxID=2099695 RepID=UPI00287F71E5|nr:cellulase family glycosylhydrolase [Mycobacterium sp. ITM-2016-00316]WNG82530.1 cellulase family glycosylhydrolase [Mycobacterium sp. ITM-2016-00316]